jgi:ELWxxDGT repeat protein
MQINSRSIAKRLAAVIVGLVGLSPTIGVATSSAVAATLATAIDPGDQGSGAIATYRRGSSATFFIVGEGDPGLWGSSSGTISKIKGFESSGSNIAASGTTMFFSCDLGDGAGEEVCKSDGTTAGTVRVGNIAAGDVSSSPDEFIAYNGLVYFTANDGANGREIWTTNGSAVWLVANINAQAGQGSEPSGLMVHNNHLVFAATDGTNGTELMRINSAGALAPISSIGGSFSPSDLISTGANLYGRGAFGGQDANGENVDVEPFVIDANWAITKVNIAAGTASSYPSDLYAWNGSVYMSAKSSDTSGHELYKMDGAAAFMLAEINPGAASSKPAGFQVISQKLVFAASTAADGRELWSYAGGGAPIRISQIGAGSLSGNPIGMTNTNTGAIYFAATDGNENFELWKTTNGTSVSLVKDINPGTDGSLPIGFVGAGTDTLFFANDNANGDEPWLTGGSAGNTVQAKNINTTSNGEIGEGVTLGAWTYFPAYAKNSGVELHRTDGNTTQLVSELQPGVRSSNPSNLAVAGGWLYFNATVNDVSKLWRTNGVTTEIAVNLNAASVSDDVGGVVATTSGDVYYSGSGPSGSGLYKLGGGLIKSGFIGEAKAQGSEVWFTADSEPFKTSGGAATAISGLPATADPRHYTRAANGDVYFVAVTAATGSEVYRVAAGSTSAVLLKDINPGVGSSNAAKLTTIDNTLFFAAYNGTSLAIYRSDGTSAGTAILNDAFAYWANPAGPDVIGNSVAGKENLNYQDYPNLIKVESAAGKSIYMPSNYVSRTLIGPYADATGGNGTNCYQVYGAAAPGRSVLQAYSSSGLAPFTWTDAANAFPGSNLWGSTPGLGYYLAGVNGLMSVEYGPSCVVSNGGFPFNYRAPNPDSRISGFEDVVLGSANGRVYVGGWKENNGGYEVWSMAHTEAFTKRLNANGMQDQRILVNEGKFNVDRGSFKFQPTPTGMMIQGFDPVTKQQKQWKL